MRGCHWKMNMKRNCWGVNNVTSDAITAKCDMITDKKFDGGSI